MPSIVPRAGVTHDAVIKYGTVASPSYVGLMIPNGDLRQFSIEPYTPFSPASRQGQATVRDFNVSTVWEIINDWSGGTGHLIEGLVEASSYAYARGNNVTGGLGTCLYTAQKGRLLPAPAHVAAGTLVNIKQFIDFNGRLYALTDENPGKIYQFDATGVTPTLVETLNLNVNTIGKQLWTDGTTLYCARGNGATAHVRQTTDGTTWTATAPNFQADFIETREGGTLCYMNGSQFRPGGSEGYPNVTIGHTASSPTWMVAFNDAIVIGKPEGLYQWRQGRVDLVFSALWAYDTANFSKMIVNGNLIYFVIKNKLFFTDLKSSAIEIYPKDVGGFKSISALAASHGPLLIGAKITPVPATSTSAGPRSVTTPASDLTSVVAPLYDGEVWANPSNAGLSDNAYATSAIVTFASSQHLKALNFGFTIPSGAAITGVVVEVEKSVTVAGTAQDREISLVKGGVVSGNNKAAGGNWPTSDAYTTYGSTSDLWGLTLTPADVNASNFGVVISALLSGAGTAQVDHIRITVYYTEAGGDLNYIFMFNGPNDPGLNPLWNDAAGATPALAIGVSNAPDTSAARVYSCVNQANWKTRYINLDLSFLPKTYDVDATNVSYIYLTEFTAGFQTIQKWLYETVLSVIGPSTATFCKVFYKVDGDFVQAQDDTGAAVEHTLGQRTVGSYFPLDTLGQFVQLKLALRTTATTGAAAIGAVTIRGNAMVKPRYQIQFPVDCSEKVVPLQGVQEDGVAIRTAIMAAANQGYPFKLQDFRGNWHLVMFQPPSPLESIREYRAPSGGTNLVGFPVIQITLVELDALKSDGTLNVWSPG